MVKKTVHNNAGMNTSSIFFAGFPFVYWPAYSDTLYYVTRKYDPSDEHRKKVGAFDEEWKTENK